MNRARHLTTEQRRRTPSATAALGHSVQPHAIQEAGAIAGTQAQGTVGQVDGRAADRGGADAGVAVAHQVGRMRRGQRDEPLQLRFADTGLQQVSDGGKEIVEVVAGEAVRACG